MLDAHLLADMLWSSVAPDILLSQLGICLPLNRKETSEPSPNPNRLRHETLAPGQVATVRTSCSVKRSGKGYILVQPWGRS